MKLCRAAPNTGGWSWLEILREAVRLIRATAQRTRGRVLGARAVAVARWRNGSNVRQKP